MPHLTSARGQSLRTVTSCLLAVGAVILLVTKKRMGKTED